MKIHIRFPTYLCLIRVGGRQSPGSGRLIVQGFVPRVLFGGRGSGGVSLTVAGSADMGWALAPAG